MLLLVITMVNGLSLIKFYKNIQLFIIIFKINLVYNVPKNLHLLLCRDNTV